jgi:hypothetical protein
LEQHRFTAYSIRRRHGSIEKALHSMLEILVFAGFGAFCVFWLFAHYDFHSSLRAELPDTLRELERESSRRRFDFPQAWVKYALDGRHMRSGSDRVIQSGKRLKNAYKLFTWLLVGTAAIAVVGLLFVFS